jgi:Cu2+-exporting ATPase
VSLGGAPGPYCCEGCRTVAQILQDRGLLRYYDLRGERGVPIADARPSRGGGEWLSLLEADLATKSGLVPLQLDAQGLHCSGCVWLVDEMFRRTGTRGRAVTNPIRGTIDLFVTPDFPLRTFVEDVERLGYRLGPRRRNEVGSDLVLRMGVSIALAMNAMIFAIALYVGVEDRKLFWLFHGLAFALSLVSLAVGGSVFLRSAVRSLKSGLLHLDLPIALGLVLGYAGSAYSFFFDGARGAYFDTLTVFTALMLTGRFLRQRVLSKNRAQLLEDGGIEGLLARRLVAGERGHDRVEIVSVSKIAKGDTLLVSPGDVVPVASTLLDASATISLDWITGESVPHGAVAGESILAGACASGGSAIRVRAEEAFEASALLELLRTPTVADREGEATSPFERALARGWVVGVLVAAAIGFGAWLVATHDVSRSLSIAIGLLVVTCPCAFGIATPLAQEIVLARLRKEGLLVRSTRFLERAASVTRVVFDKTGTLTTGELELSDRSQLLALAPDHRAVLYNLAARSSHPKSGALRVAIPSEDQRYDASLVSVETRGAGVETTYGGRVYRLGSRSFVTSGSGAAADAAARAAVEGGDVSFGVDGEILATFHTEEQLRSDARAEVGALRALGCDVEMLSGDKRDRALEAARAAGIDAAHVRADASPEDKADHIRAIDHGDTLMIGDGINDSLAVVAAHCSGTPASGRTFLAARADFYLLTAGLRPVRLALKGARAMKRTVRRNLALSLTYNAIAIGLAYAGLMSPLVCAVFMPASSLLTIFHTTRSLSKEGDSWTR